MLKKYTQDLENLHDKGVNIVRNILKSNNYILEALQTNNLNVLDDARNCLKPISNESLEIDNGIVKLLALETPEASDLRRIVSFFKITNELQRTASNTKGIIKNFELCYNTLDKKYIEEYTIPLQKTAVSCLEGLLAMTESTNENVKEKFNLVFEAQEKTDELYNLFQDNLMKENKEIEEFNQYAKVLNTLRKYDKIANRSLDIAYLIVYAKLGGVLGEVEI
ncbi:PhoU domain-containing protein [Arcobacter sp. CECT 8985]|uniref:PhoU domain-containing protein n=1 Tax=Arcobacter sp. CECT 8985 TaxID=1935424 RepID=UPI00100A39AA|nr:PhoU domain-containing protein [Arcobacter sp. CECT 8985]RXJ86379.1 PhoU family transcriptional regulator [Arcobacter sp. CECT 8985]